MNTQTYQIINGESSEVLKTFPDNHFDSVVCDPPYGISFLGKEWDSHTGEVELYKQCLRVLKPGGHLLAFSAARTYHKLASTIEEAGFEIRDQVMWLYASGFPKSQDVGKSIQRSLGVKEKIAYKFNSPLIGGDESKEYGGDRAKGDTVCTDDAAKQWAGWGNSLKPAHEPICMARKPLKQSIAKNCQEWGTGALNIDASRIAVDNDTRSGGSDGHSRLTFGEGETVNEASKIGYEPSEKGRFPSNVIGEVEGYQKFFYCPKVSRKERHTGFDTSKIATNPDGMLTASYRDETRGQNYKVETLNRQGNNHPTVKPVALMDYLIKLVTKPGGKVLDPFNGSGSTGMAAVKAGYEYVGIDLDPKYCEISRKRIDAWCQEDNNYNELFDDAEEDDES